MTDKEIKKLYNGLSDIETYIYEAEDGNFVGKGVITDWLCNATPFETEEEAEEYARENKKEGIKEYKEYIKEMEETQS